MQLVPPSLHTDSSEVVLDVESTKNHGATLFQLNGDSPQKHLQFWLKTDQTS
jgi:hypothetical protein